MCSSDLSLSSGRLAARGQGLLLRPVVEGRADDVLRLGHPPHAQLALRGLALVRSGEGDAFAIRLPGRRLLVVDDDEATRELVTELFEHAGASVRTADSAAAAFEEVQRLPPDVIIADIGMSGEDGCALMRRIRGLPGPVGQIPAVALSAHTRFEDRQSTRAAGFSEFVGKPATPQDLLSAVERLLAI